MTISRRLISLLAALVFGFAGLGLVWSSGFDVYVELMRFGSASPNTIAPTLGVVLGGVLLAAATATAAISSLGVFVFGGLLAVAGLLGVLPAVGGMEPFAIVAFRFFAGFSDAVSNGVTSALATGVVLTLGAVLLVVGLVVRGRRNGSGAGSILARVTSVIALPLLLVALYFISAGGGVQYQQYLQRFSYELNLVALIQVLVGVALCGITAVSLRWTSFGIALAGAALFVVAILGLILSRDVLRVISEAGVSGPVLNGIISLVVTGQFILIAGALLGGAVGSRVAASRAARAHETRLDAPVPAPVV